MFDELPPAEAPKPTIAAVPKRSAPISPPPAPALELDTTKKTARPRTTTTSVRRVEASAARSDSRPTLKKAGVALVLVVLLLVALRVAMRWADTDASGRPRAAEPVPPRVAAGTVATDETAADRVTRLIKAPKRAPGGGAFAMQAELAKNPNADIDHVVDNVMARSGSDGTAELEAMERKLNGGSPEDRARSQLDSLAERPDPEAAVRAIEAEQRNAPKSEALKAMLREARAVLNPKLARLLFGATPQHPGVYTRAMLGAGETRAALSALDALSQDDVRVLRARIIALSRAGRCNDAEASVTKLASSDALAAIAVRVRHEALCTKNLAAARELAETAGHLETLPKRARGSLLATAGLLALRGGASGVTLIEEAMSLAPSDPAVVEAAARVAFAAGEDRTSRLLRATDDARVLLAAAALKKADDKEAARQLATVPTHHPGAALLRVILALRKHVLPDKAFANALDAILLDRWDGTPALPFSSVELGVFAALGPEELKPALRGLAVILGGEALDAGRLGNERGSAWVRECAHFRAREAVAKQHPLSPWSLASIPTLTALLGHPLYGPHAALALATAGRLSEHQLAKVRAKAPSHPALLAAAALEKR